MQLEACYHENAALRSMLRKRGLVKQSLRKELDEAWETRTVKKRGRAAFSPIRKALLQLFQYAERKEMLEKLPVKGKPH